MNPSRKAHVFVNAVLAGTLEKLSENDYRFSYETNYIGAPISLILPIKNQVYEFKQFPPFFEGLLPEGMQLEALLRKYKLDRTDYFSQLLCVGGNLVGAVTVEPILLDA